MGTGPSVATTSPRHEARTGLIAPEPRREAPAQPVAAENEADLEGHCPVQATIRIVGRKWHLILLWELSQRPAGFNDLKQRARGISAKMLSQSLNELEADDLVVRDVVTERPLRVMYRLTEKAEDLAAVFEILHDWGVRHGLHRAEDPKARTNM